MLSHDPASLEHGEALRVPTWNAVIQPGAYKDVTEKRFAVLEQILFERDVGPLDEARRRPDQGDQLRRFCAKPRSAAPGTEAAAIGTRGTCLRTRVCVVVVLLTCLGGPRWLWREC